MKKKLNKIVFFGSGPVAAKSLKLLNESFEIECVITKASTKKEMASINQNTPVYCANNRRELDELFSDKEFRSELAILIDFGIIISQKVIDSFSLGIINSHFSILPEWRGADPITFAILSGQKKTGVSMMLLSVGMDEGDVLGYTEQEISADDTSTSLTEKLIEASHNQLVTCIPLYINGEIKPLNQLEAGLNMGINDISYSRKLTKQDGEIVWTKTADQIEREIRAYYEWPKSYTVIANHHVIIKEAKVVKMQGEPGSFNRDKKSLIVHCGENSLNILKLQPAGKKEMPIQAFLAGYKLL